MAWSVCAFCELSFTSTSAFDAHRAGPIGTRRCLTLAELQAKGWRQNGKGWWTPADAMSDERLAARKSRGSVPATGAGEAPALALEPSQTAKRVLGHSGAPSPDSGRPA